MDDEGGQSALIVAPEKHSLLIDAGWASNGKGFTRSDPQKARDADRIAAAARDAGISRIDYLLTTHFHTDHVSGVSELSFCRPNWRCRSKALSISRQGAHFQEGGS